MNTIESIPRRPERSPAEGEVPVGGARIPHPWTVAAWATGFYARCEERWRSRRALEMLDDRGLRDIGITRDQAHREINKAFWK